MTALRLELAEAVRQGEERRQANRALDREIVQLRSMLAEAERQMGNIRQTFIYRIGEAIVSARTWKGLRQLPRRLIALRRAYLERRGLASPAGAPTRGLSERLRHTDEALGILATEGFDAAVRFVRTSSTRFGEDKARALVELAHAIYLQDPAEAASLAVEAGGYAALAGRLRALVLALFDHGEVNAPALILASLSDLLTKSPADQRRRDTIAAYERQLAAPLQFPTRATLTAGARCIAVVASRSPPDDISARSLRAKSVAEAACEAGLEAILVTEPGYHHPRPGTGEPVVRTVGGLRTLRLDDAGVPPGILDRYISEVGDILATEFERCGIRHVHAAAEVPMAAASLWAARKVGASFTLDIGDFPSFGAHADADWEGRERFRAGLSLFSDMAEESDRLIIRSAAVAELFAARGLRGDAIVVPDVAPVTLARRSGAQIASIRTQLDLTDERIVCVYGAIDTDNGLCDVVRALPGMRAVDPRLVLIFAGGGSGVEMVRQAVVASGLTDCVFILADLDAASWLDCLCASHVAIFPKHLRLEPGLAAPVELQAALAVETPVVAADTPWAKDWIADGESGLLFPAGDIDALVGAVTRLLSEADLAHRISAAGRDLVRARSDCAVVDPAIVSTFQTGQAEWPP